MMKYGKTEIVASALDSAAWEMCASLIHAAYSPNIKERADCSTVICDPKGKTLALATYGPAHLGAALKLVPAILERFPLESLRPGDVFLANDPYIVGVTHLNDCTLASPIFVGDTLVGFSAAVAHHSDVGGKVPGSESGDSTSIYQEGIRMPPMKLFSAGNLRRDILEMFLLNSRTPHFGEGDIYAQKAAITTGARRVQEIFGRYGEEPVRFSIDDMLDSTERRVIEQIKTELKEGVYEAEDYLDEDGITDNPVKLAVRLTIQNGSIEFDFSECSSQLGTGKNVPFTHTMATVYYCFKAMVDPGLSVNEGMYRPIRVIAPEGSIVNPQAPGGVSSRNLTSMILADVMIDALGQAAPQRTIAAGGAYNGIILGGWDPFRHRFFVDYENFAGGHGANVTGDGMDATQLHTTNTANLPIEVMELEFPVRVERYTIAMDSGGAGRYRGGCGVVRDLRMLADDITVTVRSARQRFGAQGKDGGHIGATGGFFLNPTGNADVKLRPTFSEMPFSKGDVFRIITPGGGGMGNPLERDPEAVAADVRAKKVSTVSAAKDYGVALSPDSSTVDVHETARLRATEQKTHI